MSAPRKRAPALLPAALLVAAVVAGAVLLAPRGGPSLRVGSKAFTEGVILGEVLTLLVESEGVSCEHEDGFGGTQMVFDALVGGEIHAYVEYTGTLQRDILATRGRRSLAQLREQLDARGVRMGPTLGFNNTYDLAMRRERADALGIAKISDLAEHPTLLCGFSHEFTERADGWPGLKGRYGLSNPYKGMDHDLAYRAIASGEIDVVAVYSTDAKIALHDLVVLEDDLAFFPDYEAFVLYRKDLDATHPGVVAAFEMLENRIDEPTIMGLNAQVDLEKKEERAVAADFLRSEIGVFVRPEASSGSLVWKRIGKTTKEHLLLVSVSLACAVLLGLALGVLAAKTGGFGVGLVGVVGAAQTFPGLALLALFVPVFGIGYKPTVVALVIYSLLPIVNNTYAGLTGIARPLTESAAVLGLSPATRLFRIELPLAAPSILAGIQTAGVWNVGLAVLGGLIGAGGYGDSIFTGIRRADDDLILQGAIPSIVLALLVQGLFALLQRRVVSKGLRPTSR